MQCLEKDGKRKNQTSLLFNENRSDQNKFGFKGYEKMSRILFFLQGQKVQGH